VAPTLAGTARSAVAILLASSYLLAGCADEGSPPTEPPGGPAPVSFAAEVQPIFDAHCVVCHGAGGAAGEDLDLRPGESHTNLIGVPSTTGTELRVQAGDPDASLLYLKITGQDLPEMPYGGPLIPESDRELIRRWIAEGAADN
jgi:hypothetical protein